MADCPQMRKPMQGFQVQISLVSIRGVGRSWWVRGGGRERGAGLGGVSTRPDTPTGATSMLPRPGETEDKRMLYHD